MRPVSLSRIIILLPRGLGPLLKHTWGTRSAIVAGTPIHRQGRCRGVGATRLSGRDGSTRLNTSRTRSEKQRFTRASEHRPQRPRRVEPTLTPLGPGSSMEVAARTICLLRPAAHRLCAFLSLWSRLRCAEGSTLAAALTATSHPLLPFAHCRCAGARGNPTPTKGRGGSAEPQRRRPIYQSTPNRPTAR